MITFEQLDKLLNFWQKQKIRYINEKERGKKIYIKTFSTNFQELTLTIEISLFVAKFFTVFFFFFQDLPIAMYKNKKKSKEDKSWFSVVSLMCD